MTNPDLDEKDDPLFQPTRMGHGAGGDSTADTRPQHDLFQPTRMGAGFDSGSASPAGTPLLHMRAGDAGGTLEGYERLALLGTGGMGEVHLARHPRFRSRWVALKRLKPELANDPVFQSRFDREAEVVASLRHHHIVQVFDRGEDEAGPWLALEYVPGPAGFSRPNWPEGLPQPPLTLAERVKQKGPLSVEQTFELGRSLCSALACAHDKGVVHRDIKPLNILLDENEQPRLCDFGLAKPLDKDEFELTGRFDELGTVHYLAPEIHRDPTSSDERSDLYALGATLVFAATGNLLMYCQWEKLAPRLSAVLRRAVENDRDRRYRNAREFDQALGGGIVVGSGATMVAVPVDGMGIVKGQCAKCRHIQNDFSDELRFCESCGEDLFNDCPKCSRSVGVWVKFCSNCKANLTEEFAKMESSDEECRQQVLKHLEAGDLPEAIEVLDMMTGFTHPRSAGIVAWASEYLPRTKARLNELNRGQNEDFTMAEWEVDQFRFSEALKLLKKTPEPLRTNATKRLIAEVEAKLAQRNQLRDEIRERVGRKAFDGLLQTVAEYQLLAPDDAEAEELRKKLLAFAAEKARRVHEECWNRTVEADTITAFQDYLMQYPEGRVNDARTRMRFIRERDEDSSYQAARAKGSLEHLQTFLRNFPDSKYLAAAAAAFSSKARERLLDESADDAGLRAQYLIYRTPELKKADLERRRKYSAAKLTLTAGVFGIVGGMFIGAFGGPGGALFGSVIGCVLGAIVAADRIAAAKYGKTKSNTPLFAVGGVLIFIALLSSGTNALVGAFIGLFIGGCGGGVIGFVHSFNTPPDQTGPLPFDKY